MSGVDLSELKREMRKYKVTLSKGGLSDDEKTLSFDLEFPDDLDPATTLELLNNLIDAIDGVHIAAGGSGLVVKEIAGDELPIVEL